MNNIGIYYAYWTRNWDVDFVPFVAKVKRLGFDVLEVNGGTVANMSAEERRRLQEAAAAEDIVLTGCIGLSAEYDLASEDAGVRRKGIEFLARQAKALGSMGCCSLGGIIYTHGPAIFPMARRISAPTWSAASRVCKRQSSLPRTPG